MKDVFKMNFDSDVAMNVGVEEAILYSNIEFWCAVNLKSGNNIVDGRVWTYNTAKSLTDIFPFWNERKIGRMLLKLEQTGYLVSCQRFSDINLHSKWYSVNKEDFQVADNHVPTKVVERSDKSGNTYNVSDTKPTHNKDIYPSGSENQSVLSDESEKFCEWFLKNQATEGIVKSHNKSIRKTWRECYDFLIRNGYTKEQIVKAVTWARSDDFWKKTFFSPNKLREKNGDGMRYIDVFIELMRQDSKKPVSYKSPNAKDEYKRILAIGWDKCSEEELEWARAYQHADDDRVYKTLPTDERLPNKVGVRKTIAQLQYERDLG